MAAPLQDGERHRGVAGESGNTPDFRALFSSRTGPMSAQAGEVEAIFSVPDDFISLAGGFPPPEVFPVRTVSNCSCEAFDDWGPEILQYGPPLGYKHLREAAVPYFKELGVEVDGPGDIIVTQSSQSALRLIGDIFLDRGDAVAVEAPTYLGLFQALVPFQELHYSIIETDDDGMVPASLEQALKRSRVKFIYVIPTFQNPSGRTMSLERRQAVADIAAFYRTPIVEDDPYSRFRFRGDHLPPIQSFNRDTIFLTTMSKVLGPGLRVGLTKAPFQVIDMLKKARMGADLCSGNYVQAIAAKYISGGHLAAHIPEVIPVFSSRCDAMDTAMRKYFPSSWHWTKPDGGMFIWGIGAQGVDTVEVNRRLYEKKVAIVPGTLFYPDPEMGRSSMRLNFSNQSSERIESGIQVVGEILHGMESGLPASAEVFP